MAKPADTRHPCICYMAYRLVLLRNFASRGSPIQPSPTDPGTQVSFFFEDYMTPAKLYVSGRASDARFLPLTPYVSHHTPKVHG